MNSERATSLINQEFKAYGGDADHHGDFFFTVKFSDMLAGALNTEYDFTTGWQSTKKTPQNFVVTRTKGESDLVHVKVSVSDDSDCEGLGECLMSLPGDKTLRMETVRDALNEAAERARKMQKENRDYRLFAVGRRGAYEYGLLLPYNTENETPGGLYTKWGWQDKVVGMRKSTKKALKHWAWTTLYEGVDEGETVIDGWTIRICQ